MKRKISFDITVDSHWPESNPPYGGFVLPVGGHPEFVDIEFETDGRNPMRDAENALAEKMIGQTYHIWYWTWMD